MPVVQLPKPLQTTLDTLLMDNSLSSWQVKGGQYFTQVTIRFSTTTKDTNVADAKYRRAPPSRIIRFNNRAKEHAKCTPEALGEQVIMNMTSSTSDHQHLTGLDDTNNANNTDSVSSSVFPPVVGVIDPATSATASHVQRVEQHINEESTGNNDTNVNSIELDISLRGSVKSEEGDDYCDERLQIILDGMNRMEKTFDRIEQVFDHTSDIPINIDNQSNNRVSGPKFDENDEEPVEDDGTFTCDGCGGMINDQANSMWYRCTDCNDIDVCHECFIKDIHKHHKSHLQRFTAPTNWNIPHCDACGFSFTNSDGLLYKCTMCEDYCLCNKCKNKLLHINHGKYITEVSVEKYIKDIG